MSALLIQHLPFLSDEVLLPKLLYDYYHHVHNQPEILSYSLSIHDNEHVLLPDTLYTFQKFHPVPQKYQGQAMLTLLYVYAHSNHECYNCIPLRYLPLLHLQYHKPSVHELADIFHDTYAVLHELHPFQLPVNAVSMQHQVHLSEPESVHPWTAD